MMSITYEVALPQMTLLLGIASFLHALSLTTTPPLFSSLLPLSFHLINLITNMADYAAPAGPPPPKVPAGWKAVWNAQYSEWFFVNVCPLLPPSRTAHSHRQSRSLYQLKNSNDAL